MKKLSCFVIGSLSLVLSFSSHAQSKTGADFFVGKWNVLVTGTPYGDLKRVYILEKKENGLAGTVMDGATGKEMAKCSKVDVKDNEITLYYTSMGTDVNVVLTKKDEDHITGKALGMFDASGERVKEILQ
ncbi:MAG TPA: hypothetical protein VGQ53_09650 [Chitinophagaceae bacterium]|jgi:hypothetical protein|nr:hypothetical protein [Chitinophagaceae bacterium]